MDFSLLQHRTRHMEKLPNMHLGKCSWIQVSLYVITFGIGCAHQWFNFFHTPLVTKFPVPRKCGLDWKWCPLPTMQGNGVVWNANVPDVFTNYQKSNRTSQWKSAMNVVIFSSKNKCLYSVAAGVLSMISNELDKRDWKICCSLALDCSNLSFSVTQSAD